MTVAELIAALRRLDPTLPVVCPESNGDWLVAHVRQDVRKLDRWPEARPCVVFADEE